MLVDPSENMTRNMDMGLGSIIGDKTVYQRPFAEHIIKPATIYRMQNRFGCHYIYFLLPYEEKMVFIGPHLSRLFGRTQVLEIAEREKLEPKRSEMLEQYYSMLPVLAEDSHLFSILESFVELIWNGPQGFTIELLQQERIKDYTISTDKKEGTSPEDDLWNMQLVERRYGYENELIRAVSNGQMHRAEKLFSQFSAASFEKRLSDPIRNLKNYCIIMNTLLRKAAEQGGVHPLYLDKTSSNFAYKIERLSTVAQIGALMGEMTRSYCRLVRKYKTERYSSPVQKSIICIDADLTQDLSLGRLAKLQNISSAYLSALFKKETGQTLTDYVNLKRVEFAKSLLESTDLQVQTVAQHCGILDVHYFSRVFKKYTGQTPKEYRNANR